MFNSLNEKTLAYYLDGDINIYLGKIYKYLKVYSLNNFIDNSKLSLFEKYLIDNLFILKTIFHELEHALQEQLMIYSNDDTIEKKLIRIETDFINETNYSFYEDKEEYKKRKKLYSDCYDISIMERLADIKSFEYVFKVLESIKKEIIKIYEYEQLLLLNLKISTYISYHDMPTIRFFIKIKKLTEALKIDFSHLNFEDRLKYGFNLSYEEYNRSQGILKKRINSN
jgi:hypothetical protein